VLPFKLDYFFFAAFFTAFFAAFFAGAFLAAFLVAICLFSLFDGLHRVLQHLLQLRNV
jgi:predicted PurR-regulated permease PerM